MIRYDPEVENATAKKMRVYARNPRYSGDVVKVLQNLGVKKKNIKSIEVDDEFYWVEAYLTPKQKLEALKSLVVRRMEESMFNC